ncbi:hypothetical protein L3X38_000652 [Prunus dulcis]|uniref:Reverse transcriptase Ty1/copia-type domain-containing protein n=1 Tax=Prunus dulcis TaxID=3755 RepID=A0AAD4WQI7_PRUDU|nr:hypothetical protein L3X38_000652 [Prunus dulcis]
MYMTQPPGFIDPLQPSHVYKLNKAIYGLKQAPRAWFHHMTCFLLSVGFVQSLADSSLFVHQFGGHTIYFLFYVDDIVSTCSDDRLLQSFIDALGRGLDIKDLGNLHYFLGLQHDMLLSKPVSTPMSAKAILTSNDGDLLSNPSVFREIIGSLQNLTITRPDIAFAVNYIAQFMSQPRTPHLIAAKRILQPRLSSFNVSAESEYRFLSHASAESTWLAFLLYELGAQIQFPILLHCDNPSATYMASNPVFHACTKHIELDYHFVREKVALGSHRVCFILSIDQPADLLAKPLHKHHHVLLTRKLVRAGPPSLREGVREISSSLSKLIV